jgi:hypothetical protein
MLSYCAIAGCNMLALNAKPVILAARLDFIISNV